jgi:aspartate/methionine/tyrosine aminotransferase
MHAPSVDLFEWLHTNAPKARYNLAYSNIYGLTLEEYREITGFSLPKDFDLGINESHGALELTKALSMMYHCTKDNIVSTTGASEANYLVFSQLLGPGDECIIEQPSYQPMWLVPEMIDARPIFWPRRFDHKFRVDTEGLENLISKKTKLIVLTNLHNPSGVWSDVRTVEAIAEIAKNHDLYVLVDEIFLDGCFKRQPSSFGIPRMIVTSSATKIYGLGGLHTGWIVAPAEVAEACQRGKALTTGASSYVSEVMTVHALRNAYDGLIDRFTKRAKKNLSIVKKWMRECQDVLEWVEPDGGIVCFPKYHLDVPSVALCQRLLDEERILVNPGAYFNQEGHFRLSYGLDEETLESGLRALGSALKRFKSR